MRRIIAGLAVAVAATLVTVAPAQAAPANPVKALKKQFSPGHGVRVAETSRTYVNGKEGAVTRTTGSFAFGASGVVASDLSNRIKTPKGAKESTYNVLASARTVSVGGHTYARGGLFAAELPEGKKWVRYEGGSAGTTSQLINILDPRVLKGVLAKAKPSKGDYRGTITVKELVGLSGDKLGGELGKIKVSFLLDADSRGLITRVVSDWTIDFGILGASKSVTDTRYTGWGAKIKIVAPPKSEWSTLGELGEDTELPTELPGNALNSMDYKP
jgi:hypothetical protein